MVFFTTFLLFLTFLGFKSFPIDNPLFSPLVSIKFFVFSTKSKAFLPFLILNFFNDGLVISFSLVNPDTLSSKLLAVVLSTK